MNKIDAKGAIAHLCVHTESIHVQRVKTEPKKEKHAYIRPFTSLLCGRVVHNVKGITFSYWREQRLVTLRTQHLGRQEGAAAFRHGWNQRLQIRFAGGILRTGWTRRWRRRARVTVRITVRFFQMIIWIPVLLLIHKLRIWTQLVIAAIVVIACCSPSSVVFSFPCSCLDFWTIQLWNW